MLILISTSLIIAQNQLPQSYLMQSSFHVPISGSGDYLAMQLDLSSDYSLISEMIKKRPSDKMDLTDISRPPDSSNQISEQKATKTSKGNYPHRLPVEDAKEKRNRILRQKSSTETSGLGSSLDYTSADDLINKSLSNSRRQSSISNSAPDCKVAPFQRKSSPNLGYGIKVSRINLPNHLITSEQIVQSSQKSVKFPLETIENNDNNEHSAQPSLVDLDCTVSVLSPYSQSKEGLGHCQTISYDNQNVLKCNSQYEERRQTYYNSDFDFGTVVKNANCSDLPHADDEVPPQESDLERKRKLFSMTSKSSKEDKTGWCKWSKEKRSASVKRDCSELFQILQSTATKNLDYTELQSLMPKSNLAEMDQSLNNESNLIYANNNPSTSQSTNPQSCNETIQISATYFAELSKKTSEKKQRDEGTRLTHEQIHYLVEYWDHDTFVRLRSWALCFALLAVGLQLYVGISSSWSFFGNEKHPNYSGLWMTCIPENDTCTYRLPFATSNNGYRDSILCLLTVSTIFGIGGSGLSFNGLCVTALARKLYYYHSAGEIFFVSGMTMALAVSLYPITVEIHFKFQRHRYGYTFWLAWLAAFLLLLSALNLLMDELIQGSTKMRSCSSIAKCFKCCFGNNSQHSETESRISSQPLQQISLQRINSRRISRKGPNATTNSNYSAASTLQTININSPPRWRFDDNDQ